MGRCKYWVLFALWVLLSGSASCQSGSFSGGPSPTGGYSFAATGDAAAIGVAGLAVTAVVVCIVNTEECFPDWEALEAEAAAEARAQATFVAGYHRFNKGDPAGLEMICDAALQGDPKAQNFYGAYLLREEPSRHGEALFWLKHAAEQGNRAADLLLRHHAARADFQTPESEPPLSDAAPRGSPSCAGEAEAAGA